MIVKQHVIKRFLVLYGAPNTEDDVAFMGEYEKALDGIDPSLLAEAIDLVVKQHRFRNWPTVGECVAAVHTIAEQRAANRLRSAPSTPPDLDKRPSAESRARVAALTRDCIAKLKISGPPPAKSKPLPDVSKTAWEARFGKPKQDGRRA